jgi:branched-chain amino acid transport system substrate-binding protein
MRDVNRRHALGMLAGLGAAALTAACDSGRPGPGAPGAASGPPLQIGLVAPVGGALKAIGAELVNGFQLYLDEHSRQLGGYPIELLSVDEGATIDAGVQAISGLLDKKVLAIAGVANSALLAAAWTQLEKAKIPLLAANGIPESLQGASYIWSTSYADHEPGVALGPYVAGRAPKGRKVAVIAPHTTSGRDAVGGFRYSFGPNDKRLSEPVIWTPAETTGDRKQFRAAISTIMAMDAADVYCFYAGDAAVSLVKALRAAGSTATIYGPGGFTEGTVLEQLGEDAAGIITSGNYSADLSNEVNNRFATAYRRAHGIAPSAAAVGAYDAAAVIDKAIRITKRRPTSAELYFGLDQIGQIESPRGTWQFNMVRTPFQHWYRREVRRNGKDLANVTLEELTMLG